MNGWKLFAVSSQLLDSVIIKWLINNIIIIKTKVRALGIGALS
jgi:hypothetical protein